MSLRHILLGMLHRPMSGYDLRKQFADGPVIFWSAEFSQIYPALRNMKKIGWLRSTDRPSTKGPPLIVYRRTARGMAELKKWLRSDVSMRPERAAYIGQLIYMGQANDLRITKAFLERLESAFKETLQTLEEAKKSFNQIDITDPETMSVDEFHTYLSLKMGTAAYRARLRECRDSIGLVAKRMAREKSDA